MVEQRGLHSMLAQSVTKAAAISSTMITADLQRGSTAMLASRSDLQFDDITSHAWFKNRSWRRLINVSFLISMVSICLNTKETFKYNRYLERTIVWVDSGLCLLYTVELFIKFCLVGVVGKPGSYFRSTWYHFEFFLLLCHYASLSIQLLDIYHIGHAPNWFSVFRAPRPLILLRAAKSAVDFHLPKNRINQIFKRSSTQVYNVTVFFIFFMALYGIVGVQFFGHMNQHCVRLGANASNITINDLAIPDTLCSNRTDYGYKCPDNMMCLPLTLNARQAGYYGSFSNIANSIFTVYMAASQEGWVYVMYDSLDTRYELKSYVFYISLIFFLAWLAKNVFIAVITETFAEIRVQFAQMWDATSEESPDVVRQVFCRNAAGLELVDVDMNKYKGHASPVLQNIYNSSYYRAFVMITVVLNMMIQATFVHHHNEKRDHAVRNTYYFLELAFTILFDMECLFKIYCLSIRGYLHQNMHRFELFLVIGSSIHVIPIVYHYELLAYFQAFRILRLMKAFPILEDFVYKIFGPGKKLGGLIVFTMVLLVITSSISLQLFCFVEGFHRFRTFPEAFMSMFQILTQEGWTELVIEAMRKVGDTFSPWVAIYFLVYHLFVSLIVLSLFVAVILDNLELAEELKLMKQLKTREQSSSSRAKLPRRLQIFTKFRERPMMLKVKRLPSEFPHPLIRDTFCNDYADDDASDTDPKLNPSSKLHRVPQKKPRLLKTRYEKWRFAGKLCLKMGLTKLIEDSNEDRTLLSDSSIFLPVKKQSRKTVPKGKLIPSTKKTNANGEAVTSPTGLPKHGLESSGNRHRGSSSKRTTGSFDLKAFQMRQHEAELKRQKLEREIKENHPLFDKVLFVIGPTSRIRRVCEFIVDARHTPDVVDLGTGKLIKRQHKNLHEFVSMMTYLEWTMVFITLLSCLSMMFETPVPLNNELLLVTEDWRLQLADYIFVVFMTFELTAKVIANGIFFTPNALVKDMGGVLTVFIYMSSLFFILLLPHFDTMQAATVKSFLILRALRPLRIYTLVPHIRQVVAELSKGFKEIFLVTVLLVLLMLIFATYGVQILGGRLAMCNDPTVTNRENCTGIYLQKIFVTKLEIPGKDGPDHPQFYVPRIWTNPRNFNFDHIGNAMLALFEVMSFKGWIMVRDVVMRRQFYPATIYLHVYVFLGSMIGLTLFVGVVIANYSEHRGTALLTVDQRRWNDLKRRLQIAQPLHVPPRPPDSAKLRIVIFRMVESLVFKRFFALLILANSILLCFLPWSSDEDEDVLLILAISSAVFILLFSLEIVVKIVAFTPRGFIHSRRNKIDSMITVVSLFWICLHFFIALPLQSAADRELSYVIGSTIIVVRFFTYTSRHPTLKMLMLTIVMSMFRSFFIIIGMFLLMLFYAYTGVILFGTVKYGEAINRHANFRTVSQAILILFRIVTGEDWNKVMHDCMRSPPFCFYSEHYLYWESDCGNYYGAILFFCSFYLIIAYIVLNLLVAIIIENFSLFYSSEEDALLSYADIRHFQHIWNIVDTNQKGVVAVHRVKFLLRLLKGRLEIDFARDKLLFKHMCYEMEYLHNGDDVSFHEVLSMLSYRSVDIRKSLQLEELVAREDLEYVIEEDVARRIIREWLERGLWRIRNEREKGNTSQPLRILEQLRGQHETATASPVGSVEQKRKRAIAAIIPVGAALAGGSESHTNPASKFTSVRIRKVVRLPPETLNPSTKSLNIPLASRKESSMFKSKKSVSKFSHEQKHSSDSISSNVGTSGLEALHEDADESMDELFELKLINSFMEDPGKLVNNFNDVKNWWMSNI